MIEHLKCDECGKTSEDVEDTFCPYDEEINGVKTPMKLCKDCYSASCDEI